MIPKLRKVLFIATLPNFEIGQEFYGARNLTRASSSSALKFARTRICRTTARTSLGRSASGGLWQRAQFASNTSAPRLTGGFFLGVLCACEAFVLCCC